MKIISGVYEKNRGWIRIFGYGIKWKHISNGLNFSERNGHKRYLIIWDYIIGYLPK